MIWLAVLALPQASVAVQVRVIVGCPAQEPGVVTSANVRWGCASQASLTEGVAKLGVAGHSIVLGSGSAANTGGVRSTTLMTWLAVLAFPHASVAVHLRGIVVSPADEAGAVTSADVTWGCASHDAPTAGAV